MTCWQAISASCATSEEPSALHSMVVWQHWGLQMMVFMALSAVWPSAGQGCLRGPYPLLHALLPIAVCMCASGARHCTRRWRCQSRLCGVSACRPDEVYALLHPCSACQASSSLHCTVHHAGLQPTLHLLELGRWPCTCHGVPSQAAAATGHPQHSQDTDCRWYRP